MSGGLSHSTVRLWEVLLPRGSLLSAGWTEPAGVSDGGSPQEPPGGHQVTVALSVREGVPRAARAGASETGTLGQRGWSCLRFSHFEPHLRNKMKKRTNLGRNGQYGNSMERNVRAKAGGHKCQNIQADKTSQVLKAISILLVILVWKLPYYNVESEKSSNYYQRSNRTQISVTCQFNSAPKPLWAAGDTCHCFFWAPCYQVHSQLEQKLVHD